MSGRLWMAWFVCGPAKATWQRTLTAEIGSRAILSAALFTRDVAMTNLDVHKDY